MISKGMKLKNFKLTQRNQKGQVAIFVALIFQVIFIFFAVLINVGLLVHHKINLQQSTDMAAYYGAMKQAEMLNVISHINFQIRQAWKLMTWRYRIMGTFMFTVISPPSAGGNLNTPINIGPQTLPLLSYQPGNISCNNPLNINLNNAPVFCVAHAGFGDWGGPTTESPCKVNCDRLNMFSTAIGNITPTGGVSVGYGGTVGQAVNTAIAQANANGAEQCVAATKVVTIQFINLLTGYFREVNMRSAGINVLLKNLKSGKNDFIDLNGQTVFSGVEQTFKNNLTEANLSSIQKFDALNGLSNDNASIGQCGSNEFVLNKIAFKIAQFFLSFCGSGPGTMREDFYMSPYDLDPASPAPSPLIAARRANIKSILEGSTAGGATLYANLMGLLLGSNLKFTTGYEKNPYCQSYYAVRARTKPKIPFLPLSQVELTSVSVAKPFGGSIGPWYSNKWQPNAGTSDQTGQKVDYNLPNLSVPSGSVDAIKDNLELIPNYSLFVGDTEGLSNREVIAIYHDFILNKNFNRNSPLASTNHIADIKSRDTASPGVTELVKPSGSWPQMKDWGHISNIITATADYDPLAITNGQNSRLRDLEISAIAPNAFDLSYYSIDSDFYNNYLKNKLHKPDVLSKLTSGVSPPADESSIVFLPDFGASKSLSGVNPKETFSVRHQLAVVNDIFKQNNGSGINQLKFVNLASNPDAIKKYFTYIPSVLSSLLTGWTFNNLTNEEGYTSFPKDGAMAFGKCGDSVADETNVKYKSLTEVDGGNKYPPTPGNCVSGGRTGYSVKIVSIEAINGVQKDIGGEGTSGQILNPLPLEFINF